jgi:1-deoxy-D-xylulose-5-phosphate reductoisomerase
VRSIALLGSTGSIGVNTLDLVRRFPREFKIRTLVAGKNLSLLAAQIREFAPQIVSIRHEEDIPRLRRLIGRRRVEILSGENGAVAAATAGGIDVVLAAMVGAAGLVPTFAAIRAGKEIALANKEVLVMAGELCVREAKRRGVRLVPVDSEHSAIFQCLQGNRKEEVDRLILTASGGPFLDFPLNKLRTVTPKQALKHPNWKMGPKITVDSATMMNKGLEVLEARWLFNVAPSQIEVVIHPQSVVHSMVRYQDGSIIAQLGVPDMRIPIAYALSHPRRLKGVWPSLEFTSLGKLTFLSVDRKRYPALGFAYRALKEGGTMPAVLNAANEAAVAGFLQRRIGFRHIHRIIERTMRAYTNKRPNGLADILTADRWAREKAEALIKKAS